MRLPSSSRAVLAPRGCLFAIVVVVVVALGCDQGQATDASTGTATETTADSSDSAETSDTGDTGDTGQDCLGTTPAELAACVEQDRYLADLEFIAAPREPGSPHWQAVQDLCVERFSAAGFEVDLHTYASGVNVIGRKLGTASPDEQIILAAHYDHIPGCNGADDNATGVAGVLEAARILGQRDYPRTLMVACWDEEEDGLVGAEAYVDLATTVGDNVLFNYNFEMIGYADDAPDSQTVPAGFELLFPDQIADLMANQMRGDFVAMIVDDAGAPHMDAFVAQAELLGLPAVLLPVPADLKNSPLLADLRRSDHAAFWEVDIPAVMLTDTSNFRYANYHCESGEDAVELLDHDFASKIVASTVAATATSLGL